MKGLILLKKIIIVGAGILGASTAYHLARDGADVTLIDREEPGRATDAAAGIICPWMTQRRNKAWYFLANKGAHFYPSLIEELASLGETQTGYAKVGALAIQDAGKIDKMEAMTESRMAEAPGMGQVERLSLAESMRRFPLIETEEMEGLHVAGGARVDGRALRVALVRQAISLGTRYITSDATLVQENGCITGVLIGEEIFEADRIILTAGAWLPSLLAPAGIEIDVRFEKAQLLELSMPEASETSSPVLIAPHALYVLPTQNGITLGSTHEKTTNFDTRPTIKGQVELLQKAIALMPKAGDAELTATRVGFRPYTPDSLPIIGHLPDQEHVIVANGLGASGLTIGPFLGRELSRLALGEELEIDLSLYPVDRAISAQ